jgi:predicted DNA-binding transcriptional regulator AlpA
MTIHNIAAPSNNSPGASRITCTVREAREATGLSTATIYRAMYRGALDTRKIGRRRLVVVASLMKLLQLDNVSDATT